MFQELVTQRLQLVKVTKLHEQFILQGLSNTAVTKYMLIHFNNANEVQEQMHYYEKQYETNNGMYWVMQENTTKKFIGVIGINNLSLVHSKAELGFWLLPEQTKKGFVTEACKAVLKFCFTTLKLNRVEATIETENELSINVIKKLGFIHEGTFREYELNKGKRIDLMMWSILKKEFTND